MGSGTLNWAGRIVRFHLVETDRHLNTPIFSSRWRHAAVTPLLYRNTEKQSLTGPCQKETQFTVHRPIQFQANGDSELNRLELSFITIFVTRS